MLLSNKYIIYWDQWQYNVSWCIIGFLWYSVTDGNVLPYSQHSREYCNLCSTQAIMWMLLIIVNVLLNGLLILNIQYQLLDIYTDILWKIPQGNLWINICCNCIICRLLFVSIHSGIYKASLNGTNAIPIVSDLSKGTGLDIDCTGRICCADNSKYDAVASIKPTNCRRF